MDELNSQDLNYEGKSTEKKVPPGMVRPRFPRVEGGRDFDEEIDERIQLTHAYNS